MKYMTQQKRQLQILNFFVVGRITEELVAKALNVMKSNKND